MLNKVSTDNASSQVLGALRAARNRIWRLLLTRTVSYRKEYLPAGRGTDRSARLFCGRPVAAGRLPANQSGRRIRQPAESGQGL